ncbi:hypothetical protein SAMN05192534_12368 [Alteribacillus persepolensis]|uniref:DUF3277 domain-containing protein n=1 Tax=Alteribacillus persepolensis TaxID=568899 RepID=A0A1G8IAT6_9BACI|nr:hypothetical protein [Alteribacillus persepolensis]SDI16004.1 hypothetical protein SAMN05192534_12368 [Alteribacillus persepolensis]
MNYDPKDINIIINGNYAVGLGETMVSFEKSEDTASVSYGAQGDYSVAESHNTQGVITVTFQHNSPTLQNLRALHNSRTHFPCFITDKNDGNQVKAGGSDCRILTSPGGEFGNEISEVEAEITVLDYKEE